MEEEDNVLDDDSVDIKMGRPRSVFLPENDCAMKAQVDDMRLLNYSWVKIADALQTTAKELARWRQYTNYSDPRICNITQAELDDIIRGLTRGRELRGEKIIMSRLIALNIKVTREALRASLHRVDPEAILKRKARALRRREYHVSGPHALWHIDGNHKLIKYGLVIHGGVDGFSRSVVFMKCSNNNRAVTVFESFRLAVERFGIPSRIRTDKGTENVEVARFMIQHRGTGRRSVIAGKSVHNQRIERLWLDVKKDEISFYKRLFSDIESKYNIDFSACHPVYIFCLHYLFLDMINQSLAQFAEGWNNHSIRTEGNRTPYQLLFENESISESVAVDLSDEEDEDEDGESLNEEAWINNYQGGSNDVVVNPIISPLNNDDDAVFKQSFSPLSLSLQLATNDIDYLTTKYKEATEFAISLINTRLNNTANNIIR